MTVSASSYLGKMASRLRSDARMVTPPRQPNFSGRTPSRGSDRAISSQPSVPSRGRVTVADSSSLSVPFDSAAISPHPIAPTPTKSTIERLAEASPSPPEHGRTPILPGPTPGRAPGYRTPQAREFPVSPPTSTPEKQNGHSAPPLPPAPMSGAPARLLQRSGEGSVPPRAQELLADRARRQLEDRDVPRPPAIGKSLIAEPRPAEQASRQEVPVLRGLSAPARPADPEQAAQRRRNEPLNRLAEISPLLLRPAGAQLPPTTDRQQGLDRWQEPAQHAEPANPTVEIGSIDIVVAPPVPSTVIAAPMPAPAVARQLAHGFSSGIGLRQS